MTRSKAIRTITATLALGVIVAACGSSSAPATKGQGQDQGGDSEFGIVEAEVVKRVDAVEALIGKCMTQAGFEYFPVDYATARKAMDSNSKPSGRSPDQFRKEFGYGITTLFAGVSTQPTVGLGTRNLRVRDALSAADRLAWERKLFGGGPNVTFVVGLDSEDLSQTGGCTRSAVQKAFSAGELGAAFVNYQNAEAARVDQDPRVIAAYRDWATCMRKAGYSYNGPDDIDADLATRLDAITAGEDPTALSATAKAALPRLQGEELAIAAADHGCDVKFVADIKAKVQQQLLGPAAGQ